MILSIAEADKLILAYRPISSGEWNMNSEHNLGIIFEALSAFSYAVEEGGLDEKVGLEAQKIIANFVCLHSKIKMKWRLI